VTQVLLHVIDIKICVCTHCCFSRSIGAENIQSGGSEERSQARVSGTSPGLCHLVSRSAAGESPRECICIVQIRK